MPARSSDTPHARRAVCLAVAVCAGLPAALSAQQPPALASDLPATGFIARTHAIALRPLTAEAAGRRLVLFIDETDVTALLAAAGEGWVYDAAALPFEGGDHELIAWLVDGEGVWREALRQTFRVPGAFGVETAGAKPSLDLGVKSRLASAFEPVSQGERDTYNDVDGRLGFETELTRYDGSRLTTRAPQGQ